MGRVEMLSTITQWYKDPKVRIGALIGWGGVGKSALVRKWYDSFLECINHVDACSVTDTALHIDGIFWWGFYRSAYLEAFLNALLRYVSQGEIDPGTMKSSYEKVDKIKGYLQQSSYLIILDGLEQMQKGESGEEFGRMEHYELTELLHYLADADISSFCLITTRYPLKNLEEWNESSYKRLELIDLSIPDSLAMLKKRGTKGDDEDIKEIVARYKGHALSLTSLAGYLKRYHNGDIKQASDIEFIFGDKERFKDMNRLLQRYSEKMSEAELCFLNIFSLFRKEVTEKEFSGVFQHNIGFNDVLVNMNELSFKDLLNGLVEWRLISFDETKSSYTTHPLTKSYFESAFNEKDKKLCHKRIYHYFGEYAPEKPETLEEMQPLFEQVYHGCFAGLYDEVFNNVYLEKIHRRKEHFIIYKLGAWETDLSLVEIFFPKGEISKMPLVSKKSDQSLLLNEAGRALLCTGRPKEAEEPFLTGVKMFIEAKDWKNASAGYQNLADLQFRTGRLKKAIETTRSALTMAERAEYNEYIRDSKTRLAWILHLLGNTEEAEKEFIEADELEGRISGDRLYGLIGVWYADFFISIKRIDEALELTQKNLEICQKNNWTAYISRCHRTLSAIKRIKGNHQKAEAHLQEALELARRVGMPYLEIEALLESGRLHLDMERYADAISEANQVLKLCARTGFKLYEPDAELILARAYLSMECSVHDTACIDTVDALQNKAKSFAQSAYDKATSMHYHLPKLEAEHLLTKKE
ncbi:MAG: tetratricopeptide repeat protein [bacterium]